MTGTFVTVSEISLQSVESRDNRFSQRNLVTVSVTVSGTSLQSGNLVTIITASGTPLQSAELRYNQGNLVTIVTAS